MQRGILRAGCALGPAIEQAALNEPGGKAAVAAVGGCDDCLLAERGERDRLTQRRDDVCSKRIVGVMDDSRQGSAETVGSRADLPASA